MSTEQAAKTAARPGGEMQQKRKLPPEANIFLVLIGIALFFELLGWIFVGQSFLMNQQRLTVMILQVAVIGIIAVGVTQAIITGGVDLSSGSVVGMTAMMAASLAQTSDFARAVYPSLTDMPVIVPVAVGLVVGLLAGLINGSLIAFTGIPPFIATLGMMVAARGVAKWYTRGQPVSMLSEDYAAIGALRSNHRQRWLCEGHAGPEEDPGAGLQRAVAKAREHADREGALVQLPRPGRRQLEHLRLLHLGRPPDQHF